MRMKSALGIGPLQGECIIIKVKHANICIEHTSPHSKHLLPFERFWVPQRLHCHGPLDFVCQYHSSAVLRYVAQRKMRHSVRIRNGDAINDQLYFGSNFFPAPYSSNWRPQLQIERGGYVRLPHISMCDCCAERK